MIEFTRPMRMLPEAWQSIRLSIILIYMLTVKFSVATVRC